MCVLKTGKQGEKQNTSINQNKPFRRFTLHDVVFSITVDECKPVLAQMVKIGVVFIHKPQYEAFNFFRIFFMKPQSVSSLFKANDMHFG